MLVEKLPTYTRSPQELKEEILDCLEHDLEGEDDLNSLLVNSETIDFEFLSNHFDSDVAMIGEYQCVEIKGEGETIAWYDDGEINLVTLGIDDRIVYQPMHYVYLLRGNTAYNLGGGMGSESEIWTVTDFVRFNREYVKDQDQIDELLSNPKIKFIVE